jgi:hypothetical protein
VNRVSPHTSAAIWHAFTPRASVALPSAPASSKVSVNSRIRSCSGRYL